MALTQSCSTRPIKRMLFDNIIYDAVDKKETVKRLEPVKELENAASSSRLSHLLNIIWETRLFSSKYNLLIANC